MNDKKKQIVEAAIRLFAHKGFHAASIQEIADEAGIAKGSVYVYFKSKDDLLFSSLKHTIDQLIQDMHEVSQDRSLSPRERLHRKLAAQLEFSNQNKDFITMLMNDQAIRMNEEIKSYFMRLRVTSAEWYYDEILETYGPKVKPYALDAIAILQAIFGHYTGYMFLHEAVIKQRDFLAFTMNRLDDVVHGMIEKKQQPIFSEELFIRRTSESHPGLSSEERFRHIRTIRELSEQIGLEPKKREELLSYLHVLESELKKTEPLPPVIHGLISHLQSLNINQFTEPLKQLENSIERELFAGP